MARQTLPHLAEGVVWFPLKYHSQELPAFLRWYGYQAFWSDFRYRQYELHNPQEFHREWARPLPGSQGRYPRFHLLVTRMERLDDRVTYYLQLHIDSSVHETPRGYVVGQQALEEMMRLETANLEDNKD